MNGHSYVYIIGASAVKIGFTTDLDARLKSLQAGSPVKLTVQWAAAVTDYPGAESHLHQVFRDKRLHGEWFDLNGDAISQVSTALERYQIAEVERPAPRPSRPSGRGMFTREQIDQAWRDVSEIFAQANTDRMRNADLKEGLRSKNDAYRDLSPAKLSKLLGIALGIPVPIRKDGKVSRGYYRDDVMRLSPVPDGD